MKQTSIAIIYGVTLVIAGMVAPAFSASDYCVPATLPKAAINSGFDDLFADQLGPGWIGADSTYSTKLPDGREAFTFSDTFIGTAKKDGMSTLTGMPRNSELVGDIPDLNSNYGGSYHAPESLIFDSNPGKWFWTFSTYSENYKQLIFVNEFNDQTIFGKFTGVSGIATMDVSKGAMPRFSKMTLLPVDEDTAWGVAVVKTIDYNFIYGRVNKHTDGNFAGMKVASVPRGHSTDLNLWKYWNGSFWVSDITKAVIINTGNELDGIMRQPEWMGNGYIAVSIPRGVFDDTTLDVSFSCSPEGPWSKPVAIYTLPEITGPKAYKNEIAYLPTVHPELGGSRSIVVSYNINTTDGLEAYGKNIHIYQPRFLTLSYYSNSN